MLEKERLTEANIKILMKISDDDYPITWTCLDCGKRGIYDALRDMNFCIHCKSDKIVLSGYAKHLIKHVRMRDMQKIRLPKQRKKNR